MARLTAAAIGFVAFAAMPASSDAAPKRPGIEKSKKAQADRGAGAKRAHRGKRGRLVISRGKLHARVGTNCSDPYISDCAQPAARTLQAYASAPPSRASTDRRCLVPAVRTLMAQLETRFGAVRVVSTCRRGAVIAGTRRPSMHRYGKAVDFIAPPGRKAEVVRWLREHSPGVTMTYRGMNHVHTDVGPYHRVILGASSGGKTRQSRSNSSDPRQQSSLNPPGAVW